MVAAGAVGGGAGVTVCTGCIVVDGNAVGVDVDVGAVADGGTGNDCALVLDKSNKSTGGV